MRQKHLKTFLIFHYFLILTKICNSQHIDTLAVTPFQVIGDTTGADIYAYGLPDAIANVLSNIPELTVIERLRLSAVLQELKLYQAGLITEKNAPSLGEMLGAKMIMIGTVQKLGQEVRVNVRGVKPNSGEVIFGVQAEKKIEEFSDIFNLQDNLTQKIISQLGLKSSDENLSDKKRELNFSEKAFELYSTGLKYFDRGEYDRAIKSVQKAVEIDKNFDWAQKVRIRAQQAFQELERDIK